MRGFNRYDEAKFQQRLWTPAVLGAGTVLLWFDASDRSTIACDGSGNVSTWKDKSGNGKDATQATAGFRPQYMNTDVWLEPFVYFDSSRSMDFSSTTTAAGWMVVAVHQFTSAVAAAQYLLAGTGQGIGVGGSSVPNFFSYDGTNLRQASGTSATNVIMIQTWDPTHCYLNGTETGYASSNTVGALTLGYIGNRPDFNLPYYGYLAEVLVLNASSTDTRQRLEGYLAWRWRRQTTLDTSHPYLNGPPLIGQ